jgi:hypothetical protein
MGWDDILKKLKLVDVEAKLETEQAGVVNVKTENKTYNFHFYNAEAVRVFMEIPKTPELERAIKEEALKRLTDFMPSSGDFSLNTREEMAAASTATASLEVSGKRWPVSDKEDK